DAGTDGLFQGDNIFELYKSRTMLEKTLLSKAVFNGKAQLLIDRYISANNLRARWDNENLGNVNFDGSPQNFSRLQDSLITDSVKRVINESIGGVASSLDAAPNANPQLLSLRVPSQRKQIDVQASVAVYSEIVKNLEISKLSLRKETPLIQVIDAPVLPLESD